GPRLARYTPVVLPKPMHPGMVSLTVKIVSAELRSVVRRLGADVQAVVTTWLFLDVYGCMGERQRCYWWQDDPAGGAQFWGASRERLVAADERLASKSDVVAVVNEGAAERMGARGVNAVF